MSQALTAGTQVCPSIGKIDRLARSALLSRLSQLQSGQIEVEDDFGQWTKGRRTGLHTHVRVNDPAFYRRAVLGGGLEAAASYFRGDWDCDDLTSLFRILVRDRDTANEVDRSWLGLARLLGRVYHWRRSNTTAGSRANIEAHYDLGNEFFELWLDETLAYSSGYFPTPQASLREASVEKFDRICRQLELGPADRVLEIGTGWGGFALHAAQRYGCRVTTTTISRRQFEAASERVRAAGLSARVDLLCQDYRELSGRYDKIVSIEMIEAVGHRNFDAFFGKCGELLAPEGTLLLQAITMPERWYPEYLRNVDFIQRYIFPGGCLPSMAAMVESAGRAAELRLVHVDDFGLHYAETLRRWRRTLEARRDEVHRLGYTEEFLRLWIYYLCYCEAAFEERFTSVVQVQFDPPARRAGTLSRVHDGEGLVASGSSLVESSQ